MATDIKGFLEVRPRFSKEIPPTPTIGNGRLLALLRVCERALELSQTNTDTNIIFAKYVSQTHFKTLTLAIHRQI